jgi:hypothetical protein
MTGDCSEGDMAYTSVSLRRKPFYMRNSLGGNDENLRLVRIHHFAFQKLLTIISGFWKISITTCLSLDQRLSCRSLTAEECLLGDSSEQDFCSAQTSSVIRDNAAGNLPVRAFLHKLQGAHWTGRFQQCRQRPAINSLYPIRRDWRNLYTAHLSRRLWSGYHGRGTAE